MRSAVKFLFIFTMAWLNLDAQQTTVETEAENLEKFVENTESNVDLTDVLDQEEKLRKHPVNLNIARQQELSALSLLTPGHIEALMQHRQVYGKLTSIYELQVIEGFDADLIQAIKPYVSIIEILSFESIKEQVNRKNYHHELILSTSRRLEKSMGYILHDSDKNAFQGSPYRNILRYKAGFGQKINFGFSAEKDDGEKIRRGFISPYLQLLLQGKLRQIVLGDFQAAFGQGLCFGSGLTFGKSPFVMNIMRRQNGIRPNKSLNENELLRGIGCFIKLSKTSGLTAFYSYKPVDATLGQDSLDEGFTGLINSGNYRNLSELSKKGALKRQITGGNIQSNFGKLQCGATAIFTKYNQSQVADEQELYKLYGNHSKVIQNYGLDYKFSHRNLLFFGEAAMNNKVRSLSFVNGLVASLDKNLDISLLYREYSKHYIPSITNAFGETQDNRNESGVYIGCSFIPLKNFKVNAYSDIYHSSWPRYQVDAPSQGRDQMIELQYAKRRRFGCYARYKHEVKQKNEGGTQILNQMELNRRQVFRMHLEVFVSPNLTLKSRVEQVWHKVGSSRSTQGMLMMQDLQVQVHKKVKLLARFMAFDVDDYNSRVFAFENDMMYSFSVPAFQDRGARFYLLCKYKMNKNLYLCFRFARSSYDNVDSTGSGQDKINSNKITDTKIQISWTL